MERFPCRGIHLFCRLRGMGPLTLFTRSGGGHGICGAASGRGCGAGSRTASGGRLLPPGMINGVILIAGAFDDQLRDRHDGVSLPDQVFENSRQSLRRVFCCVVKQDDGPRLDLGGDPLSNLIRRKVFPVQTIIVGVNRSNGAPPIPVLIKKKGNKRLGKSRLLPVRCAI